MIATWGAGVMRYLRNERPAYKQVFTQLLSGEPEFIFGSHSSATSIHNFLLDFGPLVRAFVIDTCERALYQSDLKEAIKLSLEESKRIKAAVRAKKRAEKKAAVAAALLRAVPSVSDEPFVLPAAALEPLACVPRTAPKLRSPKIGVWTLAPGRRRIPVVLEETRCSRKRARAAARAEQRARLVLEREAAIKRARWEEWRKLERELLFGRNRFCDCEDVSELRDTLVKHGVKATASELKRMAMHVDVFPQGGSIEPSRRALREAAQRKAAREKAEAKRKSVPKAQREAQVKSERDKRSGVEEPQSGRLLTAFGAAAVTLLVKKLHSVLTKADALADDALGITKALKKTKKFLTSTLGGLIWFIPLVVTTHYVLTQHKGATPFVVAAIVACLAKVLGPELWGHIARFFPGDDVVPQGGLVEDIGKMLATVVCFSVFRSKMTASTVTELAKRISMFDRMSMGWNSFVTWALSAIESCFNGIRSLFGLERVQLFKTVHTPMQEWSRRVDSVATSIATCEETPSADLLNTLVGLIKEGAGYKDTYRGSAMSRVVDEYVLKASNLLVPYSGALNARNNFRFEPEACLFVGEPGIGKTVLAMPFCTAILIKSGLITASTFDKVAQEIWQKGTSEFWNSYAGQTCVVMDDAFQARVDATDKENEYMALIRMCSSWSYPLNFADLPSKGKIFFTSKFIFGTTNVDSIRSSAGICVHEPSAVVRRINHPYRLELLPQYKAGGYLDQEKYQEELAKCANNTGLDHFPWYMWRARKHDFLEGQSTGDAITLKELIGIIADKLKRKSETFGATRSFLDGFVESLLVDEVSPGIVPQAGGVKLPRIVNDWGKDTFPKFRKAFSEAYNLTMQHAQISRKFFTVALCVGIGAMVLHMYIVKTVLQSAFNFVWSIFKGFFNFGDKKKPRVQSNRPLTKATKVKHTDIRIQAGDINVTQNVYANTYKLYFYDKQGSSCTVGQVTFLVDTLAVMPEHFITITLKTAYDSGNIDDDTMLKFRHSVQSEMGFEMTLKQFTSLTKKLYPARDVAFVKFQSVRAHRNITLSFMTEKDIKYIGGNMARLDISEVDDRKTIRTENSRSIIVVPSVSYGENIRYSDRRLERFFSYSSVTSVGDCGAPLCLVDNSSYSGRTCFGFHVAGNETRKVGYSTVVTREMIDEAKSLLTIIDDRFIADLHDRGIKAESSYELPETHSGSFLPIATIDKSINLCPKTSYYVTSLYGEFGEYDYLPAPMHPVYREGVLVYPMREAVLPFSSELYLGAPECLEQAVHIAMSKLTHHTKDFSRRILTFEEAVKGVPQEKFRAIPRGTSAGFPYVCDVRDGKKEFFGSEGEYDLNTELAIKLRHRVDYVETMARGGVRCAHVYMDFLKDELRKRKKVEAVQTRLISSAPLDYTVLWRKYFGAFSSAVMRCHTVSGMAPGICTYSDWGLLSNLLSSKGDSVTAGDFKAFDSSEQPPLLNALLGYINRWYNDSDENQLIRTVLWCDLVHSRHIGGNGKDQRHIYQWNKSLPSGHPFTTICNSMYSLTALVSCYIAATGDRTGFWKNVYAVTYGDDNVLNVHDSVVNDYNQVTIARDMWDLYRLVYTSDTKDGELIPYKTLNEVSFLKRRFLLLPDGWSCPLELESFLYTVYWCKNRKLEERIRIDVLENALQELSLHDVDTWKAFAPKVYSCLERFKGVPDCLCDKNQYLALVRSRSEDWY